MALIVETGAIVAGAESYVDAAFYVTYWTNLNAVPSELTPAIEAALRKATAYIDGKYRNRFKGDRTNMLAQCLEFPRIGVQLGNGSSFPTLSGVAYGVTTYLPPDTIPLELKHAVCEAAKRALAADLAADLTGNIKRQKVDVIETEYFNATPTGTKYEQIDHLLSRFLKRSNEAVRG